MVCCKTFFRAVRREIFYTQEKKIVNSRATVEKIRENNKEEKKKCTCVLKQVRLLKLRGEMLGTCDELVTQCIRVSNECICACVCVSYANTHVATLRLILIKINKSFPSRDI